MSMGFGLASAASGCDEATGGHECDDAGSWDGEELVLGAFVREADDILGADFTEVDAVHDGVFEGIDMGEDLVVEFVPALS